MQQPAAPIKLGAYELFERIGEGGSGHVYRAHGAAGLVAVKLLAPAAALDDAARARFLREIKALGQIEHGNLVRMLDHGVDAELGPYLVLPLLPGTTLRALCAGQAVCPEAAVLLVQPIAHATAALHAAGFVHRDLKPDNVIAGPDGVITVVDLGLAWHDSMTRHTATDAAVGSVGYMSPEQLEGGTVEGAADVWAIGVMLYELIAARRPFARGRATEEAAATLLGSFPQLTAADRRASTELAELVTRCLALEPAKRPSAGELATVLDALVDWTEDAAADRAAIAGNPAAYQARVAPLRTRRAERLAREALDAGEPFAALAHCDRGLAYAPDHAGLLALVGAAEAATAGRSAPVSATRPATTVPTPPTPGRTRVRAPWPVLGAIVAATAIAVIVLHFWDRPAARTDDPWASKPVLPAAMQPAPQAQIKLIPDDRDIKMMRNFLGVFGRAVNAPPHKAGDPMTEQDRALARDTINVFGEVLDRATDTGSGSGQ